jgi:hypothetical protein
MRGHAGSVLRGRVPRDLTHRYFRKPVIILDRIDIFRSTDFALILLLAYSLSTIGG